MVESTGASSSQQANDPYDWHKIGWNTAKIAGSVVVAGGVAAGVGISLEKWGRWLIGPCPKESFSATTGKASIYVGKKLFQLGRYAFLSVAVPVYTMVWKLPKWAVTEGIPNLANRIHEYVLIPIYNAVVKIAPYIEDAATKVMQVVYDYVLEPLRSIMVKASKWVYHTVLIPVARTLKDCICTLAQKIHHYVLQPLKSIIENAVKWSWNKVIVPIGRQLEKTIEYVTQKLLDLVCKMEHIWNSLYPFIEKAAIWTWDKVIVPLFRKIARIADHLFTGIHKVYQDILIPIDREVRRVSKWFWQTIIVPVATFIKDHAVKVAKLVYDYVLSPVGDLVSIAFRTTYEYSSVIGNTVIALSQAAVNSTYETFQWISQKVLGTT